MAVREASQRSDRGGAQQGLLTFREITEPSSLHDHFRLRCTVYRESGYLRESAGDMDVDAYDLRSRFLGAWLAGANEERMVGGVRMVYRRKLSPLHAHVEALLPGSASGRGRKAPIGHARRSGTPSASVFPSQKAFDLTEVLERCDREALEVVEFSRTVCLHEYRGLKVGFGLVNGVFGLAMQHGIDIGVGSTPPHLRDFYLRLGCQPLPSREVRFYADLNTEAVELLVDLRRLDPAVAETAARFASELSRQGHFCL